MIPNPPMPDEDPTPTRDVPDLGRRDDLERSLEDRDADRAVSDEEERPESPDDRGTDDRGGEPSERPRIEPDDATPTEDPGISPI
ncbi:MAG TPA: hypothetical protein VLA82_01465 [Actinomycetota bacterium]|nr:hypothetical protein [Actinomycetota bacterium]